MDEKTIRRYRRRVTKQRLDNAAKALVVRAFNDDLSIEPIPNDIAYALSLAVLEADAEVVEFVKETIECVRIKNHYGFEKWIDKRQFQDEWEIIP